MTELKQFLKPTLCALLVAAAFVGCSDDTPGGEGEGTPNNEPGNNEPGNNEPGNNEPGNNDPVNNDPMDQCGDGVCDAGEQVSCPDDCEMPDPDPDPVGPECGDGACDEGEDEVSCPEDCDEGPVEPICEPGQTQCVSTNAIEICAEDGSRFVTQPCDVGTICVEDECSQVICRPGAPDSCASQSSLFVCNETGTGTLEVACEPPLFCDFVNGLFACTDQICEPGLTRCRGLEGLEICAEDGTDWVPGEDCPSGTQCDNGECTSLCEINSKVSSFLGCEYWSIDFDNIEGGTNAAHAVVISNPHPDLEAEITVYRGTGDEIAVAQWNMVIPPGQQGIYLFEGNYMDTNSNTPLLATNYVDGTMVGAGDQSFRFESSIPTTAHQFNPLVDTNVFTNDASLLLPTNSAGFEHLIMSWKHRDTGLQLRGWMSVLAFGEEPTTVTVTPSVTVTAGTNKIDNTPVDAIGGGETREFVLLPGQYINLETEGPAGADLTGTEVLSDQPVIVFGGHECANVPEQGINFCDHIEQQLYPVGSWGAQYVISSFSPRTDGDVQVFRILASEDQTIVTTTPPQPNADNITLNRGEFVEFQSSGDFEVSATAPILVGQYMTGSRNPGGNSIGDPAFTLAAPIEQWRRDYIVLTPQAYNRGDFLNIIAPTGSDVTVDGNLVEGWAPVADGTFSVAKVAVEDGTHTLISEAQFTVIAYGYDSDVSYAYPGGLNLEAINR